jgi:hypothetical protein
MNKWIKPQYTRSYFIKNRNERYFHGYIHPPNNNGGGNNDDSILFIILSAAYIIYNDIIRPRI